MNVNSSKLARRKRTSPCKVESEFFSNKRPMDDSLSEFQNKKSAITGPKSIANLPLFKVKSKNNSKRLIKGQKDIRAALKNGSNNDLLKYTKEFDKVCKKSGLDVDTEQLLLAVALSKSLQQDEPIKPTALVNSSSQRTGKIRTTLQEYGFTVPQIKISKKLQKSKKYKLLFSTATEKKQVISDRYTQVLFNVVELRPSDHFDSKYLDKGLYFKSTNIHYEEMKKNNVFYVENLIEKSFSTGNLLRNWCDIPGRPISPNNCKKNKMDLSEIECSQEELDIILSGSLRSTKNIINKKAKTMSPFYPDIIANEINNCDVLSNISDHQRCEDFVRSDKNVTIINETQRLKSFPSIHSGNSTSSTMVNMTRSCSPDLFDDESPNLLVNEDKNENLVYGELIDKIVDEVNKPVYFMDLTQNSCDKVSLCLKSSQSTDYTRRNSNDSMEITECVAYSIIPKAKLGDILQRKEQAKVFHRDRSSVQLSQPVQSDRTQRISNDFMEITECIVMKLEDELPTTSIDLTQNSSENDETDITTKLLNKNKVLNNSQVASDIVEISTINEAKDLSLEDTIILDDDEIDTVLKPSATVIKQTNLRDVSYKENVDDELESKECENYKDIHTIKTSQSFFDEFEVNHSDETSEHNTSVESKTPIKEDNEIDLTQSSYSVPEIFSTNESYQNKLALCSLGKKDEVSVDYDDILTNSEKCSQNSGDISQHSKANVKTINGKASSQILIDDSCAFDVCDQINFSKYPVQCNKFESISRIVDLSKLENFTNSEGTKELECNFYLDRSMTESVLPDIDIKVKTKAFREFSSNKTPDNNLAKVQSIPTVTPAFSNYIVKTDQVTPMLDYASMATPERNNELDKYGLKPFKRKRAVQLLTHLYNQTHPLVQSSSKDTLSPLKKRKCEPSSPKKTIRSPKETLTQTYKENHLYHEVPKEVPDIKDIECLEEDWIFQKREKAKVHSCRMPLHIAFFNYVSCRPSLRETILRYEPVNIDEIHKGLVSTGYRYDPKDLLRFMDKKCITVKTADNNARNNKRH